MFDTLSRGHGLTVLIGQLVKEALIGKLHYTSTPNSEGDNRQVAEVPLADLRIALATGLRNNNVPWAALAELVAPHSANQEYILQQIPDGPNVEGLNVVTNVTLFAVLEPFLALARPGEHIVLQGPTGERDERLVLFMASPSDSP